jgi:hypothetical protein
VFGYGLVAWEFSEGARNWAFPGLIAGVLGAVSGLGGDRPDVYLPVVRLAFVAMSLGTALGTYGLARVWKASEKAAAVGAAAWSLAAPAIYFAHRALSENGATVAAVWALVFLLAPRASRRSVSFGASLLGLAVLFRIQMGILAVGVLGVLIARADWRVLRQTVAVLVGWAMAYGAIDAIAWNDAPGAIYGGWFHSAILYGRFNLEGRSAQWGTSPPEYYAEFIARSMPLVAAGLAIGLAAGLRFATALSLLALLFLAAHSAVPHKEFRFIMPMLPLAIAATAISVDALPRRPKIAALGLLLIGGVASAATFRSLTWSDLGARLDQPDARTSAWDAGGRINRLLLVANQQPDLCGLRVDAHAAFHGAFTYLHRRVHIYHDFNDVPPSSGLYNYAIINRGSGWPVVRRDGEMELVRIADVTICNADPGYDWDLP